MERSAKTIYKCKWVSNLLYQKLIENKTTVFDKTILIDKQGKYTYRSLDTLVKKIGMLFLKMKLGKGSRIIVVTDGTVHSVAAILACIAYGVVFVPCAKEQNINYIRKDCDAEGVVDRDGFLFTKHGKRISWQKVSDERTLTFRETNSPNDICYILYTSGSTAEPKGVVGRLHNVLFCIRAINSVLKYGPDDTILNCLPLCFDYGLYQVFLGLFGESRIVIIEEYLFPQIPILINKYNVTIWPVVPTMLTLLLRTGKIDINKMRTLRMITSTGEVLRVDVIHDIMSRLPGVQVLPMYGLTECKRVAIMPPGNYAKIDAGSCGRPLPGISVYLEDVNDEGIGELCVTGPNVMDGYWRDEKETNAVFLQKAEYDYPVVRSGDLFKIDGDGYLYYCGRKKRMIKTCGHRVSPLSIESEIYGLGNISQVRALPVEDALVGEKIALFICSTNKAVKQKVKQMIEDWPNYLKPGYLIFTDNEFPINRNGKIDDKQLMEMLMQRNNAQKHK